MSNAKGTGTRISRSQLIILWSYLNSHRDLATAFNRSHQEKAHAAKRWRELAQMLNAQGLGFHKDWRAWSKYWIDYKAKLKKKVAVLRLSQSKAGGEPSTEQLFSDIDKKFLTLLGENFRKGLTIPVEPSLDQSRNITTVVNFSEPESTMRVIIPDRALIHEEPLLERTAPIPVQDPLDPPILVPKEEILDIQMPLPIEKRTLYNGDSSLELQDPQPIQEPLQLKQEPLLDPPVQILIQEPLLDSPVSLPTQQSSLPVQEPHQHPAPLSPQPATSFSSSLADCPRRRRRRKKPMSQEAARRSLVESSRLRAEVAQRNSRTLENCCRQLEKIAEHLANINDKLDRIERYIEGLHSEQKYITPWEKSLTPMPINPDPNQFNIHKIPAHWMTEEAVNGYLAQDKSLSETDIQKMDQSTKILKGLCSLRDFLMKDALCLYKNQI